MSYGTTFFERCAAGDFDGAFDLVRSVFHAPENQTIKGKPSDFLLDRRTQEDDDDDDGERKLTPREGFDSIVAGFRPKKSIEKKIALVMDGLDEGREEFDPLQALQPFDVLVAQVGTYERGSVTLMSGHRSGERRIRQYGLSYEIVDSSLDCHEEYTFLYDLTHSERYRLTWQGETLENETLLRDLKLTIFARYLRDVFAALVASPRFAKFPKALPFAFEIEAERRHDAPRVAFPVRPPLTLGEIEKTRPKLVEDYRAASEMLREIDPIRMVAHFMVRASKGEPAALEELVKREPELKGIILTLAEEELALARLPWEWVPTDYGRMRRRKGAPSYGAPAKDDKLGRIRAENEVRGPAAFTRVVWALGDAEAAKAYSRDVFRLALPAWEEKLAEAREQLSELEHRWNATWEAIPKDAQPELLPELEAAKARILATDPPPWIRVLLMEIAAGTDDGVEDEGDDDQEGDEAHEGDDEEGDFDDDDDGDGDGDAASATDGEVALDRLPPGMETETGRAAYERFDDATRDAYVRAVVASAVALRAKLGESGAGGTFDFHDWNFALDRLAAIGRPAAAAAPALLEVLDRYTKKTLPGWAGEQFVIPVAVALYRMGLEEPPPAVHELHAQNPYYMEAFYPGWAARVPTKRLERLLDETARSPAVALESSFWETHLHDSEPGMKLVVHHLLKKEPSLVQAATEAAARSPAGPLLRRMLVMIAKHAEAKDDALLAERALAHLSDLDAESQSLKVNASLYGLLVAIDGDHDDVPKRLELVGELVGGKPNATFWFAKAWRAVRSDPRAAAEVTLEAVRALSEKDRVYRKAFFAAVDHPYDDFAGVDRAKVYGFFRVVEEAFASRFFEEGKPSGDIGSIERDYFYQTLSNELGKREAPVSANARAFATRLVAYGDALRFVETHKDASLDALAEKLPGASWEVGSFIAARLASEPNVERVQRLLDFFAAHAEDERRRLHLTRLLWPIARDQATYRAVVLRDPRFQAHLPWFIERYPAPRDALARTVLGELTAMGLANVAIACARALPDRTLIAVNVAVLKAFDAAGDIPGAIALLERLREAANPKDPNSIVLHSNLAVLNIRASRYEAAEGVFDRLFALDFSNFDYTPKKDDTFLAALGPNLDDQYATVFRIQMANARYNAACLYALTNRPELAIASLRESCRLQPETYTKQKLASESDFASLRGLSEFDALGVDASEVTS